MYAITYFQHIHTQPLCLRMYVLLFTCVRICPNKLHAGIASIIRQVRPHQRHTFIPSLGLEGDSLGIQRPDDEAREPGVGLLQGALHEENRLVVLAT